MYFISTCTQRKVNINTKDKKFNHPNSIIIFKRLALGRLDTLGAMETISGRKKQKNRGLEKNSFLSIPKVGEKQKA